MTVLLLAALAGCGGRPGARPFEGDGGTADAARDAAHDAAGRAGDAQASGCVLFGGFPAEASGDVGHDTWFWNGTAWTPHSETLPKSFTGSAVTVGGEVLLIGVENSSAATSVEVWAWHGTSWTQRPAVVAPPERAQAAVAALGTDVVLFGGRTNDGSATFLADTWVWDGATWVQRSMAVGPPARARAAAANVSGRVLVFGGMNDSGALGDTWVWEGTEWQAMMTARSPSARSGAAAATLGDHVVLFGGCVGGSYQGCADVGVEVAETWEWSLADGWRDSLTETTAGPRDVAVAATLGSTVVLFGGFTGTREAETLGDTWLWDGKSWASPQVAGPPGRGLAALSCR